ncbi:hypothetical protein ACS0X5_20195 [Burkholderia gladioli]|uniref:hypothetical protein n=1 Tax=Burkholderia gladioli TaxID=28095 RepID=UPI0012FBEA47|nr:hypothetical protein [Burkholderia gladioli]
MWLAVGAAPPRCASPTMRSATPSASGNAGAWSANYEFEHIVAGRYLFRFLVRKTRGADFREFDRRAARLVDAMIEK